MRPRKKVLLFAATEVERSLWTLRLSIGGYDVLCAESVPDALQMLAVFPDCYMALYQGTRDAVVEALRCGGRVRVLLFDVESVVAVAGTLADAFEVRGPILAARVLERLKSLRVMKTGPKAGYKWVSSTVATPRKDIAVAKLERAA